MSPRRVAGVDGCPAGWFAVWTNTTDGFRGVQARLFNELQELTSQTGGLTRIAIDIPIGLLNRETVGGRTCDREARRLLGRRASTLFTAPKREDLEVRAFEETEGLSLQAFHLIPKIREVDRVARETSAPLYEAHPELAWMRLQGEVLTEKKKSEAGRKRRLALLRGLSGASDIDTLLHEVRERYRRREVRDDDILDALVLTQVALDLDRGCAACCGDESRDACGLPMKIYY